MPGPVIIHSGTGSLKRFCVDGLPDRIRRILLVTGRGSFRSSGAEDCLRDGLRGRDVLRFYDFDANPKLGDAIRGAEELLRFRPDTIVAVGGGSVLDMAKLIVAFAALGSPTEAAAVSLVTGNRTVDNPGLPIVAVPTTAGSGAEATHFAVVYIAAEKYSLALEFLRPGTVVLDGELMASTSPFGRACSGLDALAQGIESAWAVNATPESRELALAAIERIVPVLPRTVAGGGTADDRQTLIEAANLAGRAIDVSKTTAAHAWSYGFTALRGIPHGQAVWMTLPAIFALHQQAAAGRFRMLRHPDTAAEFVATMFRIERRLDMAPATDGSQHLCRFMAGLGVPAGLEGIPVPERVALAERVNADRMNNNPVVFSDRDKQEIFGLSTRDAAGSAS